jgi:hypothetical protein
MMQEVSAMQPRTPVNVYTIPITMGNEVTTAPNVYRLTETTSGGELVPLRIVDAQRDLDQPAEPTVLPQN